jgi:coenzyme F420-reducing hydrogenase delta subunit
VEKLKGLLKSLGISPERLEMYNISAAMGPQWAENCRNFTQRIKELGPSPVRT